MAYYGSQEYANRMAAAAKAAASAKQASALDKVGNINSVAAWKANQVSKQAQADQYAMNLQMMREANALQAYMMQQQMDFNSKQSDLAWNRSQQSWNQTSNFNASQNAIAQEYNSREAEKNRQFQERMSNTSYQRVMEDMRRAGLNPILAYMQGGASVPSGNAGSISGSSMSTIAPQMASVSQGSANSGSVSSYSGTLENTSNMLATIGAVSTLIHEVFDPYRKKDGSINFSNLWKETNSAVRAASQLEEILDDAASKISKRFSNYKNYHVHFDKNGKWSMRYGTGGNF